MLQNSRTMMSLMRLLNFVKPEFVLWSSSGFVIEYRETVYPELRFLYHYPNPSNPGSPPSLPYSSRPQPVPSLDEHRIELARRDPQCRIGGVMIDWFPPTKYGSGSLEAGNGSRCPLDKLIKEFSTSVVRCVFPIQFTGSGKGGVCSCYVEMNFRAASCKAQDKFL